MSFIALKTAHGKYVGTDSGALAPLICMSDEPVLFEVLDSKDGDVMLRVVSTGYFVAVVGEGQDRCCIPQAVEPGPECLLRFVALTDGYVAIQAANSPCHLSVRDGQTVLAEVQEIGAHERFQVEPREQDGEALSLMRGCCGSHRGADHDSGAEVFWEEGAHRKILDKATAMLAGLQQLPEVKLLLDSYWNKPIFQQWVYRGLKDADDKSPWTDNNWRSHFYNPVNGQNYAGSAELTAMSEGRRYFGLSKHVGQRIFRLGPQAGDMLFKHAGYYLGLSLHFLTDLTQPMHAANFTNVWGDEGSNLPNVYDRRHAGFEVFADDAILFRKLVDDLEPLKESDVTPFTSSGSYLHEVASGSRKVFEENLKGILHKKASESFHGIPVPLYRENFWRMSEADPALRLSLRLAPLRVARYLVNWSRGVQTDLNLSSDRWYSILEPSKAPANPDDLDKYEVADMKETGLVQRWASHGGDNQRFYLMFNDDGTMCIGSKKWKNSLWLMYQQEGLWWVGHSTSSEPSNVRFRAVQDDQQSVWIFEPTRNEVVSVKWWGTYQGYFIRWDPSYPRQQLFRFRDMGPISAAERDEIKKSHPNFGKWNWWGAANVVPKWEQNLGD